MQRLRLPLKARFTHRNESESDVKQRVHRLRDKLGPLRQHGIIFTLINLVYMPLGVSTNIRLLTLELIE